MSRWCQNRRIAKHFVIFGQPRSGTTLLGALLNQSPDIACDGELFNPKATYISNRHVQRVSRQVPVPFVYWRMRRRSDVSYGFKLLSYQTARPTGLLRFLHRRGWQIIFVRRRNVVRQALSRIIGDETGSWHRRVGDDEPSHRIEISTARLDAELEVRRAWSRREADALSDIPHVEVWYEDDLRDVASRSATIERLARAIDVTPWRPDAVDLVRTDGRPLTDIIENYDELRAHLEGGPYSGQL